MDPSFAEAVEATFERIQRPLRRAFGDYRSRKVRRSDFVGRTFSRARGGDVAGLAYGFALRPDALPGIREPPEAAVYVFVRPVGSALHEALVARPRSPVRRLVADGRSLPRPFEFHPRDEAAAVRHRPMGRLPPELFVLSAADFFMTSQRPLQTRGFIRRLTAATDGPGP